MKNNKIVLLAMLYVTFKITCDPMFFRQIAFTVPLIDYNIKIGSASLVYPFTYITCDAIVALSNKNRAAILSIVLIGILCDGIFSNCLNMLQYFNIPPYMSPNELVYTNLINSLGSRTWSLFYHGMLAATAAKLAEIYLFSKIFKKLKRFLPSTFLSITSVLLIHNIISDYPLLSREPDALNIVVNGTLINLAILLIYTFFLSLIFKLNSWNKPNNICVQYITEKFYKFMQNLANISVNKYEETSAS